jgi:hypothetical protein
VLLGSSLRLSRVCCVSFSGRTLPWASPAGDLGTGVQVASIARLAFLQRKNFLLLKLFSAFLILSATGKEAFGGDHDDERTLRCSSPSLHFVRVGGPLARRQ